MSGGAYDQTQTLVIVALGFAVTWMLNQPRGDLSRSFEEDKAFRQRVQKLTGLPYSPTGELEVSGWFSEWDDEHEVDKKVERLLPDIDYAPVLLVQKAEIRDHVDGLIDVWYGQKDSDLTPQDLARKRELEGLLVDLERIIATHKERIKTYGGTGVDWEKYAETEGGYLTDPDEESPPTTPRGGWTNPYTDANFANLPAGQYFPRVAWVAPGDADAELEETDIGFTYLRDGEALPYVDADV